MFETNQLDREFRPLIGVNSDVLTRASKKKKKKKTIESFWTEGEGVRELVFEPNKSSDSLPWGQARGYVRVFSPIRGDTCPMVEVFCTKECVKKKKKNGSYVFERWKKGGASGGKQVHSSFSLFFPPSRGSGRRGWADSSGRRA